jgi:aminoglycoside phosphotransferase family enzyme/predicted kinase
MGDDQREVIRFLSQPSAYGLEIERVEVVETHIALVFLAGERAYKLKRAVRYPYLDFSTVERRHQACATELALNRRTAPSLYLGLRALGRTAQGAIGFVEEGPAVDWVVVLRRFDQALLFDALARDGRLSAPLMRALTDRIAEFHGNAERRFTAGGAAALRALVDENDRCLKAAGEAGFVPQRIDALREQSLHILAARGPLCEARRAAGKVRRVHGDLHLRNIVLLDGQPTMFDCLEFSEALATIDVLYDLAFLLMDLEYRGLAGFTNLVMNRYLDLTGEDDGLPTLPLFLSLRAAIRAHVAAVAMEGMTAPEARQEKAAEARRYLDLALRLLQPQPRRLIAIGGLSGTGKSSLAAALAPSFGARVLRSDVIRKRLFSVPPETRLPATAYDAAVSTQVYDRLRDQAAAALAAGYAVIIDAVALRPEERHSFATLAACEGVPFAGLWLEAPAEILAARLDRRRNDASDASAAVLAEQLRRNPGPLTWARIDVAVGPDEALAAAHRALAAG